MILVKVLMINIKIKIKNYVKYLGHYIKSQIILIIQDNCRAPDNRISL